MVTPLFILVFSNSTYNSVWVLKLKCERGHAGGFCQYQHRSPVRTSILFPFPASLKTCPTPFEAHTLQPFSMAQSPSSNIVNGASVTQSSTCARHFQLPRKKWVSSTYRNTLPVITEQWLKQQKFIFPPFWRLEVQYPSVGRVGFSWNLSVSFANGRCVATSSCDCASIWVLVSSSGDTSHVELAPPPCFNLITSLKALLSNTVTIWGHSNYDRNIQILGVRDSTHYCQLTQKYYLKNTHRY